MTINNFWFMNSTPLSNYNPWFTPYYKPFDICMQWFTGNNYSFLQPWRDFSYLQPQIQLNTSTLQIKQPTFQFNQSNWNLNNYGFDTFTRTSSPINNNTTNSPNFASLSEYNAQAGEKLANIALRDSVGFTEECATYVKNAIKNAGLGAYQYGDAYETTNILNSNKNFKQISTNGVDVSLLPAGCVLVYDKGVAGYSSNYGHTEITTGDGRAVSDGITNNPRQNPSAIFIPV